MRMNRHLIILVLDGTIINFKLQKLIWKVWSLEGSGGSFAEGDLRSAASLMPGNQFLHQPLPPPWKGQEENPSTFVWGVVKRDLGSFLHPLLGLEGFGVPLCSLGHSEEDPPGFGTAQIPPLRSFLKASWRLKEKQKHPIIKIRGGMNLKREGTTGISSFIPGGQWHR